MFLHVVLPVFLDRAFSRKCSVRLAKSTKIRIIRLKWISTKALVPGHHPPSLPQCNCTTAWLLLTTHLTSAHAQPRDQIYEARRVR